QRTSTIRAGEACGVKVTKIINEPTAAAISYGYKHSADKTLLVYDLGGGTFDVTIVRITKGNIDVVGTAGDHYLGGKNWDSAIVGYIAEQFKDEYDVDPRDDAPAANELIVAAEGYKKNLSVAESVPISFTYNGCTLKTTLTREEFEAMTEFLIEATRKVCVNLIEELGMTWGDIDEILLCGGSTRMPAVSRFLREISGKNVIAHSDTDLAVAKGAAITAELYSSTATGLRAIQVADVTAHSLGALSVSQDGTRFVNEIMIKRNSKVPATTRKQFSLAPGNVTNSVEVYTLQGESRNPLDCNVLAKVVITGFENRGKGVLLDIEYKYDENGVVDVTAYQDGRPLDVTAQKVPDDIRWMGGSPKDVPRKQAIVQNIAICVDLSRSMNGAPFEAAKSSIRDFVRSLSAKDTNFSLIVFGDKVKVVQELTPEPQRILDAIELLKVNMAGRGTDASPLEEAHSIVTSRPGAGIIVVLTDGEWGKRDKAVAQARSCRNDNVTIFAVGLGDADRSFLRQIATVDDGALYTTIDRMGEIFSTIATAISIGSMGIRESPVGGSGGLAYRDESGLYERE
ncbi:MAG: Hsp70 family protein, partial [Candidatus Methanomethylophilaceae archaeon]|nr:Hsp70 family protein [Candidatus Methanomethylophilaceae archaeon]